jgi:uncharacterized membrane protein YraQ (UPF0718 family)
MKNVNDMAKKKQKQKKTMARDYIAMAIVIITAAVVLLIFPGKSGPVLDISKNYLLELAWVLPAVMVIIGLFSVWVSNETVVKYIGRSSGAKGIFFSIVLGMLPTGPIYIAFPMAVALLKKGAKISNIIIFISAWACIKLPQELMEIQFLGIEFTALRLALTIIFVVLMGIIIEKIIVFTDRKKIRISENLKGD